MRLTTAAKPAASPDRIPPFAGVAILAGALIAVFVLDRETGSAPVQHLYYVPIVLSALLFRMRGGIAAGLLSILLYHAANPHLLTLRYEEADFVQMALFLAVGVTSAKLARDADSFRRLAMTDDLTGLHNLRSFEAQLLSLVRAGRTRRVPLTLLVLDVDRLKALNDQYDHLTGAEAVRTVGHIIGKRLPPTAVACRYGGDEFVVAAVGLTAVEAHRLADDLRQAVHASATELAGRVFPAGSLSISVGVVNVLFDDAAAAGDIARGEEAFRSADAALYRAKALGRNQVFVA